MQLQSAIERGDGSAMRSLWASRVASANDAQGSQQWAHESDEAKHLRALANLRFNTWQRAGDKILVQGRTPAGATAKVLFVLEDQSWKVDGFKVDAK